ncbi:MAG: GlsB/YeaQ/YmgE family stress response membrane protein [Candidatus Promineifilaceae bacterium]
MSVLGLILLLIIAAIAGAIGQAIVGYSLGGFLVSAGVGLIGAFLGLWLSRQLGLPELMTVTVDGEPFPIIWSVIGSAIFALLVSLVSRRRLV